MIFIKYHKQISYLVIAVASLLAFVVIMSLLDVYSDIHHGVVWSHILIEMTIVFCSLLSAILLTYFFYKISDSTLNQAKFKLNEANDEIKFWHDENKRLVQGLAANINQQFNRWDLSKSEAEIGFFLIKGFSLKEISEFRSTSERTVREQAGNIYKKANLNNRNELTAFFLEDLLSPQEYKK